MDLSSKKTIKALLLKSPSKGMGQHFLTDKKILLKIIESAGLDKKDMVLEIGPGLGTLTNELSKRAGKVLAIEKDKNFCKILNEIFKDQKNVEISEGDILKFQMPKLSARIATQGPAGGKRQNYKVVANLPYYITSPIIRMFLESENPPEEMVLMVQKEVAQRICAKPPNMSLLSLSVQFYAEPRILFYVSKKSFWPAPKVDSAILKIANLKMRDLNFSKQFFKIAKAGFSQPRKQIVNNLAKKLGLQKEKTSNWLLLNGITPSQRAETLSLNDWINLAKFFADTKNNG